MKITNYTKLLMAVAFTLIAASTTLNAIKVTVNNTWREDLGIGWNTINAQGKWNSLPNIKAFSTATFEIPENKMLLAQGYAAFKLLDKDISLKLEITPERRLKFTEVK